MTRVFNNLLFRRKPHTEAGGGGVKVTLTDTDITLDDTDKKCKLFFI